MLLFWLAAAQELFVPAPGSPIQVDGVPQNIVCGDVNGDGNQDLLTANGTGNNITVLLGDGRGAFRAAPGSPVRVAFGPGEMALADFNRDGRLDLATASHDSYDVVVLLGNGRGGFAPAPRSPFAATVGGKPHTHGLAAGDADGDGNPDIFTVNNESDSVSLLLGDGRGGFTRAAGSPFTVDRSPYPLAIGDVNSDGKLDIVTPATALDDRNITVLLGDGKGRFAPAAGSPFATTYRPYFTALADVNGDRSLDILAAHDDRPLVSVLLGDGRGSFRAAPGSPFDLGGRAWGVTAGDVNGDGRIDIVAAADEHVRVLLGDGRGGFTPAAPVRAGRGVWRLCLVDLNRDGKLDVAASSLATKSVTVLLGR